MPGWSYRVSSYQALSKTPMCQSNSMLEMAESSWCLYAFIAVDDFFITDSVSKQGGSELDSSTDSKDKVFTVGWFGWVVLLSIVTPMRPVVSVFSSSLSLNYTSMRDWEKWGQQGCGWNGKQVTREARLVRCTAWKMSTSRKEVNFAYRHCWVEIS